VITTLIKVVGIVIIVIAIVTVVEEVIVVEMYLTHDLDHVIKVGVEVVTEVLVVIGAGVGA
jgi:hypothetical protein